MKNFFVTLTCTTDTGVNFIGTMKQVEAGSPTQAAAGAVMKAMQEGMSIVLYRGDVTQHVKIAFAIALRVEEVSSLIVPTPEVQ